MKRTCFSLLLWAIALFPVAAQPALRYFQQPADVAGSATPYGDNPAAGRYVEADGARLYLEVYGEGRPLLVLHGGGMGSPYELGAFIDRFRQTHRVIVLSTRGHGRSEMGSAPLTAKQRADDALCALRAVSADSALVFGFDDGAYAACWLAVYHPQAVRRVVAIGAGTVKPGQYAADVSPAELEKADADYIARLRRIMPEPERLQEYLSRYATSWSQLTVGKETFNEIKCPVLIVAGELDERAELLDVLTAYQETVFASLCIVPSAGHRAFLDNFELVWAAVGPFFEEKE